MIDVVENATTPYQKRLRAPHMGMLLDVITKLLHIFTCHAALLNQRPFNLWKPLAPKPSSYKA